MRLALLLLLGAAAPVAAQQPAAPADAAALLRWHLDHEAPPADAEDAAFRTWVYVQAGAEGEVRASAAQLERLAGDDVQAGLFRLEADCWSPRGRAAGLRRAADWLQRHEGQADPARVARVRLLYDFLQSEEERAAGVRRADAAAGWVPGLALAAFVAMALAVGRLLRR